MIANQDVSWLLFCYDYAFLNLMVAFTYFVLFFGWMAQKVEEADRASEGFYIRSGITVVLKNSVIMDGTII